MTELLVSQKAVLSSQPATIPAAMRQIERWSTAFRRNPVVMASSFSSSGGGYEPVSFVVDAFNYTHILGIVAYSGAAVTTGSTLLVGNIPLSVAPLQYIRRFNINPSSGFTIVSSVLDVKLNGTLQLIISAAMNGFTSFIFPLDCVYSIA